jgi:hypothetical protein
MKLYINGVLKVSDSLGNGIMQQPITVKDFIGAASWGPPHSFEFKGYIDQTIVWDRALTQANVTQLYNSGNGLAFTSW